MQFLGTSYNLNKNFLHYKYDIINEYVEMNHVYLKKILIKKCPKQRNITNIFIKYIMNNLSENSIS